MASFQQFSPCIIVGVEIASLTLYEKELNINEAPINSKEIILFCRVMELLDLMQEKAINSRISFGDKFRCITHDAFQFRKTLSPKYLKNAVNSWLLLKKTNKMKRNNPKSFNYAENINQKRFP